MKEGGYRVSKHLEVVVEAGYETIGLSTYNVIENPIRHIRTIASDIPKDTCKSRRAVSGYSGINYRDQFHLATPVNQLAGCFIGKNAGKAPAGKSKGTIRLKSAKVVGKKPGYFFQGQIGLTFAHFVRRLNPPNRLIAS